ncbi:MAG: hypothetical protein JWM32_1331 [Verrucomicrobia bacterium]|nr:hypothetical protein [Verrucomicrobiota bacterium]
MAKGQSHDPLVLSSHWHVDCRLPAELPDDRVVSSRFLLNLPFGALTVGLLVFFCWELSTDLTLNANISEYSRKLNDSRVQLSTIKQQQRDYTGLAFKIESAHTLMKNRLFVSHFMSQLSRSRPDSMVIEAVDSLDSYIIVRGGLTSTAEEGTRMVGNFLAKLREDPEIGPRFESILLSSFERTRSGNEQAFELTFRYKDNPP